MYFLQEFRCLEKVGTIDMENFSPESREKMRDLADRIERERSLTVTLTDISDGFLNGI